MYRGYSPSVIYTVRAAWLVIKVKDRDVLLSLSVTANSAFPRCVKRALSGLRFIQGGVELSFLKMRGGPGVTEVCLHLRVTEPYSSGQAC